MEARMSAQEPGDVFDEFESALREQAGLRTNIPTSSSTSRSTGSPTNTTAEPHDDELPNKMSVAEAIRVINEYNRSQAAKPKGTSKYPWELWADGQWHSAVRGEDFHVTMDSFRTVLYAKGRRSDKQVTTRVLGRDSLEFIFTNFEADEEF